MKLLTEITRIIENGGFPLYNDPYTEELFWGMTVLIKRPIVHLTIEALSDETEATG